MAFFNIHQTQEVVADKRLVKIASGENSSEVASISVDVTSAVDYQDKTADDFIVQFTRVQVGPYSAALNNTGMGISINKTYNASTGILTLTASGTNNSALVFGYVNAAWHNYFDVYVVQ